MTLPRHLRLRPGSHVQRVFKTGRKAVSPWAVLYWEPGETGPPRLAVVTGRRLGGAVVRNRLRRLYQEAFRSASGRIAPGSRLVLVVRSPSVGIDLPGAEKVLTRLLGQGGLLVKGDDRC